MSSVSQELREFESPRLFLDEAYQSLGYTDDALFNAVNLPEPETKEEKAWLDKGDWLALAYKVGAEKVFFVENNPVLVFCALEADPKDDPVLLEQFRRVWCMARPQYLFVAVQGELQVYRLDRPPAKNAEELRKRQVETVRTVREVAEKLYAFRREQVELGSLLGDKYFGEIDQRADKRLIQDLKAVRRELLGTGLKSKYAHALIGRSIFIRYLEDRRIIDEEYFLKKVAKDNVQWQQQLLHEPDVLDLAPGHEKRRYYRVLPNQPFTYALFRELAVDFNGDMFPDVEEEEKWVTEDHLRLLQGFLLGHTSKFQYPLFLWAYDFEIIPIELISSIYEEFYHKENIYRPGKKGRPQDDVKTHYTPSVLVEFVFSHILSEERLATTPRILDPACGSGIFLVEAFRRIVRYQVKRQRGKMPTPEALRQILKEQIRGIEIYDEAVHVAAFSLYLALLHYQEPPTIRTKRLPNLIYKEGQPEDEQHYHVLFRNNTFALIDTERDAVRNTLNTLPKYEGRAEHQRMYNSQEVLPLDLRSFDIVVGNPPWGFTKGETQEIQDAQKQAKRWSEYFEWSIGDDEPSQAFIARALSLLKPDGESGLLVPTGVFLKHHENSKAFRKRWLEETTIKTVVNFAHVRHTFFNTNANAPFAFVHFVAHPTSSDHWVRYWSVRKSKAVDRTQTVVLRQPDIRQIQQIDLETSDFLWKVYWWGNHHDANLIKALRLNITIDQLAKSRNWPDPGRGFQAASPTYKNAPGGWLKDYKVLPAEYFQRYGQIDTSLLQSAPQEVTRLPSSRYIQDGWRLLIKQGVNEAEDLNGLVKARLENLPYAFNSSIHGVNIDRAADWERKVLIGITWSSLARYYFMTVSSWGTWHHQLHLEEAMNLPIRFPDEGELRREIVEVVDTLLNWPVRGFMDGNILEAVVPYERRLDEAIFTLYNLNEAERDLVLDLCEVNLEFLYRHSKSNAARSVEKSPSFAQGLIRDVPADRKRERGLQGYIYAFLKWWNREIAPGGEFRWHIIRPSRVPMIAVVFTTQEVRDPLPDLRLTDEEEWATVLKRCSDALKQEVSRRIYIDNMVRVVTDTEIYIIKRDERRLWTRSMAREDAEATLVQAMHLQEIMQETV